MLLYLVESLVGQSSQPHKQHGCPDRRSVVQIPDQFNFGPVRFFLSKNNPRCWLLDLYVTNRCYQVETTSIINWIKSSYPIWIMCKRFISDGRFQRFLCGFIANVITYDTSQWCPIRLGRIYGTTNTKCFILNQKFKRTHYLLITIL